MTAPLCLALAQISAVAGDIAENTARHIKAMQRAAAAGAQGVIFAELSLTGYEPDLAARQAFDAEDARLRPLRDVAEKTGLTVVVGAPLKHASGKPQIAAWWLTPAGGMRIQTKQYLHDGESAAFTAGESPSAFHLHGNTLALAICADATRPQHAAYAAQWQPTVYVASSVLSPGSYAKETADLRDYATRHQMAVALVNHGGPTGGYESAGQSALWDRHGALVAQTPGPGDYLLLLTHATEWQGHSVALT